MNEEEARTQGDKLCTQLGSYWESDIWQNFGWHYAAKLTVPGGYIKIYPRDNGYWVDSRLPNQFFTDAIDTFEGIKEILNRAENLANETIRIIDTLRAKNY